MTGKIKVHIDPKGYDEKPSGKEIRGADQKQLSVGRALHPLHP